MGKTPVVVANRAGFVVNRLFVPCLTEAFWLLEEGARPEAVDRAMVEFGFATGPLQLIDMSGVDILARIQPVLGKASPGTEDCRGSSGSWSSGGIWARRPEQAFTGMHRVPHAEVGSCHRAGDRGRVPRARYCLRRPGGPEIVDRLMLRMVAEAFRMLEEGVVRRPADLDVAMVLGTGLADFRGAC